MIDNTFVFNPIRADFIEKALKTLYKHTDMEDNRVIVIDQTKNGLFENRDTWLQISGLIDLYIRPNRNLGFSKSMNEGIIHGLRWGSNYITCCNDDIEFMDKRWWGGILETFNQDEKIKVVNPMSPKEPGWGYGLPHGMYLEILEYKENYTNEDYDYLLKGDFGAAKERFEPLFAAHSQREDKLNTFPAQKIGVIDAIATWCTIFKREAFELFGMFEERYYPGGGEDYDYNARVYRDGYRMVGTTRSWVWHHWGKSKDTQEHNDQSLPPVQDLCWMKPDELWPPELNGGQSMDPWGKWTDERGNKHPMKRDERIGVVDL